jgi:hypothetical protein
MSDITDRLRRWSISTDAVPASDIMEEAADEIDRLRSQPCPYVTGNVTRHCTLTPLTLTDAERDAVRFCAVVLDMGSRPDCAATLRGLLERMK